MVADGQGRGGTGRKRKRPLPASDSSKSTTTNSGGAAGGRGGTCPISASLCSTSATTQSLSGPNHGSSGTGNASTTGGGAVAAASAAPAAASGGHQPQAKKRVRTSGGEPEEAGGAGAAGAGAAAAGPNEAAKGRGDGERGRGGVEEEEEEEEEEEDDDDDDGDVDRLLLNDEEEEDVSDEEEEADLDEEEDEVGRVDGAAGRYGIAAWAGAGAGSAAAAASGPLNGRRRAAAAAAAAAASDSALARPFASGSTVLVRKSGTAGAVPGERKVAAAATAAGKGAVGKRKGKGQGRPDMVRQVERLVATLFKDLDVLLRAEDINRRVMYRWSGAERASVVLGEGKTSYCTWGRELIKQYIEDAIELVRTSLATGDWNNSVEAARRLTLLYLGKASERSIVENEPVLHAEVMNTLGNLWFALLPYMPPPQRKQFRRLVARICKTGGAKAVLPSRGVSAAQGAAAAAAATDGAMLAAGAAGKGGGMMTVGVEEQPPMGETGGHKAAAAAAGAVAAVTAATPAAAPPPKLPVKVPVASRNAGRGAGAGAGAGVDDGSSGAGDAEAEALEGRAAAGLVVSFRCALEFAKLDLSPEALAAGQGSLTEVHTRLGALLATSDVYDCDAYICLWKVSEVLAGLPGFRVLCQEFRLKALDAEMWRCMLLEEQETKQRGGSDDSDEEEEDDDDETEAEEEAARAEAEEDEQEEDGDVGGDGYGQDGGAGRLDVTKLATIPAIFGVKKFESTQRLVQRSAVVAAAAAAAAMQGAPAAPQPSELPQQQPVPFLPTAPPTVAAATATAARRTVGGSKAHSSSFSSLRHSSALEGQGGGSRLGAGERWRTKAALEDEDYEQYLDYLSLHQHEYRRVMTPDFLFRAWTFLEAFDPFVPQPPQQPQANGNGNGSSADALASAVAPMRLLFIRARPFLYRVATMIPTEELAGFLDLLCSKFGYQDTLQLLEPLIVEEQGVFSTGRVAHALEWAIGCDGGAHLPLFTRLLLPRLSSRTQLERVARRAIAHGLPSLPVVDRALARVPRHSYEGVALALCRRAVECWGPGQAHLVVLRALQGMPSLGLYLKCRGCFLEPVASLVRPLVQQLDPAGELSIGVRLVEGVVQSAVNSIVASLEGSREGSPERRDRGRRWLDFCFAGVRGGQFPPSLLDRLFAAPTFVLATLGPPSQDPACLEALAGCFARLAEMARHPNVPPAAISGPVRSIIDLYMHHAPRDVLLRVAVEKGVQVEETAIEVAA